jgi:hypothetical protein
MNSPMLTTFGAGTLEPATDAAASRIALVPSQFTRSHGPHRLRSLPQPGRNKAQQVADGLESDKTRGEIANYKHFRSLGQEVVEANKRACEARRVVDLATDYPAA